MAEEASPVTTPTTADLPPQLLHSRQIMPVFGMIDNIIERCPVEHWDHRGPNPPIWQHIYHALFWTNVWLRPWHTSYVYFPQHTDQARDLIPNQQAPIAQADMSSFSNRVRTESLNFIAKTGHFYAEVLCNDRKWTISEIVFGQIRHMQHHIGYVHSMLKRFIGTAPRWIGYGEDGLTLDWYHVYLLEKR